jgi:aspartyl-tRNA(Asn)/glutamyl-tRNA(Gln) amidotransferase subunit C
MAVDRTTVEHVARLARLFLTDEEIDRMSHELTDILGHAEKIQTLPLDDVEPTSHALPLKNVMRDDEVTPSLPHEVALANAPDAEAGRFKVPRIIEEP